MSPDAGDRPDPNPTLADPLSRIERHAANVWRSPIGRRGAMWSYAMIIGSPLYTALTLSTPIEHWWKHSAWGVAYVVVRAIGEARHAPRVVDDTLS